MFIMHTIKKRKYNKGFVTLEAAIFLPLMIVSIISIALLMKGFQTKGYINQITIDELRVLAVNAYTVNHVVDSVGYISDINTSDYALIESGEQLSYTVLHEYTRRNIVEKIYEKVNGSSHVNIDRTNSTVSDNHKINALGLRAEDLIDETISYKINMNKFWKRENSITHTDRFIVRHWHNDHLKGNPLMQKMLQEEDEENIVIIFSKSGKRYHIENCRLVLSKPYIKVLSHVDLERYNPCELCIYEEKNIGDLAYVFSTGESYHNKTCSSVSKQITYLTLTSAINQGYTPCQICEPYE